MATAGVSLSSLSGSTATSSSAATNSLFYITSGTATTANITTSTGIASYGGGHLVSDDQFDQFKYPANNQFVLPIDHTGLIVLAHNKKYQFPDGSILNVDKDGNYKISDKSAKVKYQACRIRAFNRYINASDLLEEFIKDMGKLGAKQGDILNSPLELFINWLICTSAEADGAPYDDVPKLPGKVIRKDRCRCCGQFIHNHLRRQDLLFAGADHYQKYLEKLS